MPASRRLLIAFLVTAAAAFAWFGYSMGLRGAGLLVWAGFSFSLPIVALLALRLEQSAPLPRAFLGGFSRNGFAAFALALALFFAVGGLSLPFIGFALFRAMAEPWFPFAFALLAVCCYPIAKRLAR